VTRVKICGVNSPFAFDTAVEAGADWIGFVFFPPSPRYVTPTQAAVLSARAPGGPGRIGLFVTPTDEEIIAALAEVKLDVLQLYASAARAAALRTRFGVRVWHATGVSVRADLPAAADGVDGLLIEAKPAPGATRPGGNAVSVDWSLLACWNAPAPWVLAGGLTPDNVAAAIRATGASAVDVSSGVENACGVKDPALIRAFVTAAKGA
jgi:phosphoribosylanthranilate isomerase